MTSKYVSRHISCRKIVNFMNFINITLICHITKQRVCETVYVNVNKTLVWPHDVESFQGSKFCLFVMVQPWNIGVCCIDQVFVTELTVVIFFVHAAVLSIKTAFNLVKIHLLFRIIPLIQ